MKCAFDSVWHDGLVFKLAVMGFPVWMIKLIKSFLKNRTFSVLVRDKRSQVISIPAGVPQGAILSPTLFNLFVSDVPRPRNVHLAQYADDIALYYSARLPGMLVRSIQTGVNKIVKFCRKWRLKLNPSKTECVYFSRRISRRYYPRRGIKIEDHESEWTDQAKYLGVTLDKKLTFKPHVDQVIQKSGICVKSLYSLLHRRSKLHTDNKLLLYKTVIRPVLMYACPVWGQCAATHLNKIQVTQNRLLKMCLTLPRTFSTNLLHERSKVELVKHFIARLRQNFLINCSTSENPLISVLPS